MIGMNLLLPEAQNSRCYGVVIGVVTNNQDPDKLGRVKVKFPWLSDQDESNWARIATPMAGKERGLYCLPEVDDEVLVVFEQGDMAFPYILGALWNGKDKPPGSNDDGKNNVRMIKSRSGHIIRLTDESDQEKIEIIDKSGKNSIVFDTAKNTIAITSEKDITLSAPKGTIKLDAQNVEIKSTADTKLTADKGLTMKASASAKLEASAGIAIEAKGTTNIKGATINLN
jgi:uncharacterized protein involved in type VI secretion and phage assembly